MKFRRILQEHKKKIKPERNRRIIEEYKKSLGDKEIAKMLNLPEHTVHLVIRDFLKKKS